MKLESILKGAVISGIVQGEVARVFSVDWLGDSLSVVYKTDDGRLGERVLFRADEPSLSVALAERPWSFDANGADFKLAAEAYRINLAHLFDPMMAVHTSNVAPLPHQITAVYESMLPRQPLRYVLADDPGAGKTIMAGLLIRELLMRADAVRILIVAPGSLVEQWQDEMDEKFGLSFAIFSRDLQQQTRSGNAFNDCDLMVARIDQLARNDELQEKIRGSQWDLVVVDEAHKLSATWYGKKVNETKRFRLGQLLGSVTRHFLLMTATPHNGKEEDFQLFMSLLDSDRFYGKFRDGAHRVDVTDLMRRMVKEDLLKFDGTRLFPERRAYTANYQLSPLERELYDDVTTYVKEEMNRADKLDGKRKGTVGFALTALQRRLASSPEAIYQSIKRRHRKLVRRVEEERSQGRLLSATMAGLDSEDIWDSEDEMPAGAYEAFEEEVVDQATAAQTIAELETEILTLAKLEVQAKELANSGHDRKWEELRELLQNTPEMLEADGLQRKLIIFTEHRDTLNYLADRIRDLLGSSEAVVMIHGGVTREARREVQELFRNDRATRVLLATDAAGEGVNLQNAHLMVNYDLPWNPNRLEQRFGRIHRIGQTEVCHLWNIVAAETREGDVFQKLFDKIEIERAALGGRVFDILGEVFEGRSLRELLIDAIRFGEDPARKEHLREVVMSAMDREKLLAILERNALAQEVMGPQRLFALKEDMEKAEARKLQPYFIRSFFAQAFSRLGGEVRSRGANRYEITFVPALIRERDRQLKNRSRRSMNPVVTKYERICFDKECIRVEGKGSEPAAELVHAAHPLMLSIVDLTLEQHRAKLKQGAIFVDPNDEGIEPKLLFFIDHSVKEDGEAGEVASRRLQFVTIDQAGTVRSAGWAPHLDLDPIDPMDKALVEQEISAPWIKKDLEAAALAHSSDQLVPEHFDEVRLRREEQVDKNLTAIHERLVKEIDYWTNSHEKLRKDYAAGKEVRLSLENARRTIDELSVRLDERSKELRSQRHVVSGMPVVIGGALVIPSGLLAMRRGEAEGARWTADAAARARVERVAMDAVNKAEVALGHEVIDVSAEKCGWDLTAVIPAGGDKLPLARHIEVKGRAKGQSTITVTRNEILYALNQADKFLLAIVIVDGEGFEGPHYVRNPFTQEPDWAVTSVNLELDQLLKRAVAAEDSF
ncbi:DUF3883 domain-containing protein [Massilia forsythiae]|uniref:DUF3883 domain-containing protein n=1 Tax=Massilia forsythiae TaxID=2728020 RepID=A0A7Z2VZU0_9BURK|nr:helicase-related protein [Massilia forsythiae]QJE02498.1 DUF3883 domain-containing protein [Massilia forsythiae]